MGRVRKTDEILILQAVSSENSDEVDDFLKKLHDQIHISGAMRSATGRNIHQKLFDEAIRNVMLLCGNHRGCNR